MSWSLVTSRDRLTIVVTFEGKLNVVDGVASALAFADALRARPVDVVWDVRKMTGYDAGARVAWQNALWPLRRNIRSVEVLGGNAWVRLGALTLTALLGVAVRFSEATEKMR